jgi:hypothetical protein
MHIFDLSYLYGFGGVSVLFAGLRWLLRGRRIAQAVMTPPTPIMTSFEPLLQQRQDLVARLVQTVRAASTYDHEALNAVVTASVAAAASSSRERADSESKLAEALNRLFASIAQDPVLSASPELTALKSELAILGRRLEATPGFYLAPSGDPLQRAMSTNSLMADVMMVGGAVPGMLAENAYTDVAATSLFASKPPDPAKRGDRYAVAVAEPESAKSPRPDGDSPKTEA